MPEVAGDDAERLERRFKECLYESDQVNCADRRGRQAEEQHFVAVVACDSPQSAIGEEIPRDFFGDGVERLPSARVVMAAANMRAVDVHLNVSDHFVGADADLWQGE